MAVTFTGISNAILGDELQSVFDGGTTPASATSTAITYTNGTVSLVLNGTFSGLTGTVTSISYDDDTAADGFANVVSGLNVSLASLVSFITTTDWTSISDDDAGTRFNSIVFKGNDTITGNNGQTAEDLNIFFGGAGNDKITVGDALSNEIYGFDGNNEIVGGAGDDYVEVGHGNNSISLAAGDDTVMAGDGNNKVNLGAGENYALLGAGNNTVTGGDNGNWIQINWGPEADPDDKSNNKITTGNGEDFVQVAFGNNTINVGDGDNAVWAGYGNNKITSGTGDDSVWVFDGNNTINAGNGDNQIWGEDGNNTITTGTGDDTVFTYWGNNKISTGDGDDTVFAGWGDNTINVGNGDNYVYTDGDRDGGVNNKITAGDGDDTIIMEFDVGSGSTRTTVFGTISAGDGDNSIDVTGYDVYSGGEDYESDGASVTIKTGGGNDRIDADYMAEVTINAGAGTNNIYVYADKATITTGADADYIHYDNLGEYATKDGAVIKAGDGDNVVIAHGGKNSITTGSGADEIYVSGEGTVNAGSGNDYVDVDYGNYNVTTGNGDDWVDVAYGTVKASLGSGSDGIWFGWDAQGSVDLGADSVMDEVEFGEDFLESHDYAGHDGLVKVSNFRADDVLWFEDIAGTEILVTSKIADFTQASASGYKIALETSSGKLYYDADGAGSDYTMIQIGQISGSGVKGLTLADVGDDGDWGYIGANGSIV